MSDIKLNPCPFCGGNNIQSDCFSAAFSVPAGSQDCFDYCRDCDAQGPAAMDMAGAHDRWNARGQPTAPRVQKPSGDASSADSSSA
jgi:hypothetical protein